MRRFTFSLSILAMSAAACGSDPSATTAGAGGSTSSAATTSSAASSSASSSTSSSSSSSSSTGQGTGGAACAAAPTDACGACMGGACCDAVTDCAADAACTACVTAQDSDACDSSEATHARVNTFLSCRGGPCQTDCIGATSDCKGALTSLVAPACQTCLEASCCAEVGACHSKEPCWNDCLVNHSEAACHADPDGHALYHALGTCWQSSCAAECAAPTVDLACDNLPAAPPSAGSCIAISATNKCNPLTNAGCDTAGDACDLSDTGYACYGPPNTRTLCQTCSAAEGYCEPGHTCVGGKCGQYCCDDADCGATGHCDTTLAGGGIGVCLKAVSP